MSRFLILGHIWNDMNLIMKNTNVKVTLNNKKAIQISNVYHTRTAITNRVDEPWNGSCRSKGTRGPQHLQRCFRNIEDVIIHNYRAQTWLLRSEREGGKVVSGWPCVVIVLIITSLLFPSLHPAYTLSRAWLYRIL